MKDLLRTFLRVIGSLETGAEPVSSAMCAFSDIRYENYLPQLMFTASTMILFITAVKKKILSWTSCSKLFMPSSQIFQLVWGFKPSVRTSACWCFRPLLPHMETRPSVGGFSKISSALFWWRSHTAEIKDGSLFMKYIMIWGLLFETLHICDDLTCI